MSSTRVMTWQCTKRVALRFPLPLQPVILGSFVFFYLIPVVVLIAPCLLFAQDYSRVEVGTHVASLTLSDPVSGTDEKVGFGAGMTYNVSPIFAWDVETDFFPGMSGSAPQRGGRAFLLLAGPKAGWRGRKLSVFLKARPGFVNFSDALRVQTGIDADGDPFFNIVPGLHLTHLALDLGGTMEVNTSSRTFIRIDVSEMLVRYGDRIYRVPGTNGSINANGVIGNSLLVTAGLNYRLGRLNSESVSAESPRRWEIGGQYGVLSLGRAKVIHTSSFLPVDLGDEQGLGARLTYNVNRWLAVDSVVNYFFTNSHVGDTQRGGKILQGTFGPKAGFRTRRWGVFAKVEPGFLSYGGVQDSAFPPFPKTRLTHFAVDFGSVLEFYPSPRTLLRFDLGHTEVFYHSAKFLAPEGPPFFGGFTDPGFRDKGMQFTTGFGWRF